MAPRETDPDDFANHPSWLDEQGEDEENEEYNLGNREEIREYVAEVRVQQREAANRELARNAELQYELRQSVTAMEQMIESQQRIERIQRSLTYLRDLHSRMVAAGVGQGSDSEEDDDEEDSMEEIIDHTLHTRAQQIPSNNILSTTEKTNKRVPTVSESSDVSMLDAEEETT